jgi:hypothetical protein
MKTLLALLFAASAFAADITVDKDAKTVSIPCKIAPRKLANLGEIYPIEVIATWPAPKGLKAHETIVTVDVKPSDVHKALESLGLKPGKPAVAQDDVASGAALIVLLELPGEDGAPRRVPIEKTLVDRKTGKTMPSLQWVFTGSLMKQPDPDKPDKVYGADTSGTLIAVFPVTAETVIQSQLTLKDEPLLKMETDKKLLPAEGTTATLIIKAK